jgi:hypothetical protein
MTYPKILPKSRYSDSKNHTVTKEFNTITILSTPFNLDNELGAYYLDMREAFLQYDAGIFGDFDDNGVPMVGWGNCAHYSAVNIAQYGFILHSFWLENKSKEYLDCMLACLNKLIEMESHEDDSIFWRENYISDRYVMKTNWASAMSLGECLSFYLRIFQITKNEKLLEKAHLIINAFNVPVSQNGVSYKDKNNNLWLEEYPSNPASCVLNGFIYAIFGLMDYYRITNNSEVKKKIDECFVTLINNISLYDAGYWSYYDLQYKELVKYYYQKNVHVPQLEVIYKMTNNPIFDYYAKKWKKNLNPINHLFVQLMYRIRPRWQKLKKIFK